ncbi:MAG: putative Alpha-1,3/1,6-mannosyltransferase ALG2 [Streblomastix strix]|uniref:Alpha-1,3/1,6-mannosyltransferase ALG2 n=1 Tax=Streblomastix strix TaxID=222440 RepID=A0A5J4X433_9EUKA|nr:MAG: putative Alpha-1,3/1,6-mannosyltransferase ALG2 [Streblomastix strix]
MANKKICANIVIVHPELIIGGAERLILDAAIGLQQLDHKVEVYTGFLNKSNCFSEVKDGTIKVNVRGNWLPKKLFGIGHAFFSILRMIYISFSLVMDVLFRRKHFDVIMCDQVSICIPILKLLRKPIFFYCHFPDRFLSKESNSMIKRAYRYVIDGLESYTMNKADAIAVNSIFTQGKFANAFPNIVSKGKGLPVVLYPPVDITSAIQYDEQITKEDINLNKLPDNVSSAIQRKTNINIQSSRRNPFVVLSINRFEKKKNILLAIRSFKACQQLAPGFVDHSLLVIAGGYDQANPDNRECYSQLKREAIQLGLAKELKSDDQENNNTDEDNEESSEDDEKELIEEDSNVIFVRSFSSEQKASLLGAASCLLYTPSGEHFGIVPVEAMSFRCPVIAVDDGGPRESIIDGGRLISNSLSGSANKQNINQDEAPTGFLCRSDAMEFAGRMIQLKALNDNIYDQIGWNGRQRAQNVFSLNEFADGVERIILNLLKRKIDPELQNDSIIDKENKKQENKKRKKSKKNQ